MGERELICPSCARMHPAEERFCSDCGMPLVRHAAEPEPVSDRRSQARKIKPQYSEGPLVKVAWATNQVEGEFIAGLLLEEGIPSMSRSSGGFDLLDFLAAGPRDILVPESGAQAAREALAPQQPLE
jgi:hypothetical protein